MSKNPKAVVNPKIPLTGKSGGWYAPVRSRVSKLCINPHIQTLVASIPASPPVLYRRETILTPDGDFLDLDWKRGSSQRLCIVSHGLEGCSQSPYLRRMVRMLHKAGMDVLAWNMRGCSGRLNNKAENYHAGLTQDLETVVNHVLSLGRYEDITLVGYSLGGNLTLRYCAEQGGSIPTPISKVVALSVPCDLQDSAHTLISSFGGLYNRYLVKLLVRKAVLKAQQYPEAYEEFRKSRIRTIEDFDNVVTAPHFGFRNALDYWIKASAKGVLEDIRVPTWIISSEDDPFFTKKSIPLKEAELNPFLNVVVVQHGGHLGFFSSPRLHRWTDDYVANTVLGTEDQAKLPLWINTPGLV